MKGEIQGGGPTKIKVPKQDAGTEQPIVVMKSAKANGAKGLRYLRWTVVNQSKIGKSQRTKQDCRRRCA